MFERPTTFWRANSGEDQPSRRPAGERPGSPDGLTRAQARALSRCAPLTPAEFKARSRMVDQGIASLSTVLHEDADPRNR
jgi:hypothetical protein